MSAANHATVVESKGQAFTRMYRRETRFDCRQTAGPLLPPLLFFNAVP